MTDPNQILVFDRALVRARRDRAAAGFAAHGALFRESAAQLIERLGDIKQEFPAVLDLGAHDGGLARHFAERGTPLVVAADISEGMLSHGVKVCVSPQELAKEVGETTPHQQKLRLAKRGKPKFLQPLPQGERNAAYFVVADEEYLPFGPARFDLIASNLGLHWVNDLPGALVQIKTALRPGGLFLAALIGGESLHELRSCLMDAELAITGGASPRLSPTIQLQTASALLQRAGFALPVADSEKITLAYKDAFALMRDLRGMGEANAHLHRLRHATRRQVFFEAARLYRQRFAGTDGLIAATFEIVFLHGVRGQG